MTRSDSMMDFGGALAAIKSGKRAARAGWNGNGMWLCMIHGHEYNPTPTSGGAALPLGALKLPWIGLRTVNYEFVPWTASQSDLLANDWVAE